MSIFADGPDIYDIEAWHSTPWRNYRRDAYRLDVASSVADITQHFYISEEDLVGLDIVMTIKAAGEASDYIENMSYTNPAGVKYDTYSFNQGYPHAALYRLTEFGHSNGNVKNILPGLWYQGRTPAGSGANDYGDVDDEHAFTITEEMIKPKIFDGGIHSYMCLPRAAESTVGATNFAKYVYSKPFSIEVGTGKMLSIDYQSSVPKVADDGAAGNVALTLDLEGSVDKEFTNPEFLHNIFDDLDFVSVGAGNSSMWPYMITNVTHPALNYYRLKWYVEDGSGDEAHWSQSDIWNVSVYTIK